MAVQSEPLGKARETELYYIQVPGEKWPVSQPVDFLPVTEFLEDEEACKAMWDMVTDTFKTRRKFLTIWPCVRFVAVHRRHEQLAGILLVSTPLNWQIDYVMVHPERRGEGIASALVKETLNQALARKVPYVMLTSREGLRPLYEGGCGFTVIEGMTKQDGEGKMPFRSLCGMGSSVP
jgi:ribosomal protein S18 acetylase RimI-like enzyme